MKECFRCGRNEEEVNIYDAISYNEAVDVCESCALIEGIPLLRKPSVGQLKTSERSGHVYDRLKRMSGIKEEKPKTSLFQELIKVEKTSIPKREEPPIRLVDNFHWIILHERRHKGLTTKQLADAISESETAVKMIERNNLPEGSSEIIKKIEQFLRVTLFKGNSLAAEKMSKDEKNVDSAEMFSFKRPRAEKITISDLQEIQRNIEKDFPTKSSEEIGREQLSDFGSSKETLDPGFRRTKWFEDYQKRKDKPSYDIPKISDLAERKKEQIAKKPSDPDELLGDDIELIDDE